MCLLLGSTQLYSSISLTDEREFTVEIPPHLQSYLKSIGQGGKVSGLRNATLVRDFLGKAQQSFFDFQKEYSLNEKITLLHDLILLGYNSRAAFYQQPYDIMFITKSIIQEILKSRSSNFNADDFANSLKKILQNTDTRLSNLLEILEAFSPDLPYSPKEINDTKSLFKLIKNEQNEFAQVIYTKDGKSYMLLTFPWSPEDKLMFENDLLVISYAVDLDKLLYIAENVTGGIDIKNRRLDQALLKTPSAYSEDIGNLFNQDIK